MSPINLALAHALHKPRAKQTSAPRRPLISPSAQSIFSSAYLDAQAYGWRTAMSHLGTALGEISSAGLGISYHVNMTDILGDQVG